MAMLVASPFIGDFPLPCLIAGYLGYISATQKHPIKAEQQIKYKMLQQDNQTM
jgi:hypothetical protein